MPFFFWLFIGFVVWTFFFQGSIEASKSIYRRLKLLSKMNFPLSLIPNVAIFSKFYTSTLSTLVRDVHLLLNSLLRMALYLSGVLWPLTLLSDFPTLMRLMQLNPLVYLIEGYR